MFAKVIIDIKIEQVNQLYDYIIPKEFLGVLKRGMRVIVPFNTMTRLGFVFDIVEESDDATKEIMDVLDLFPVIDKELFLIIDDLTKKTTDLQASIISNVIPSELLAHYEKHLSLINQNDLPISLRELFKNKSSIKLTKKDLINYPEIKRNVEKGILKLETKIKERQKSKVEKFYQLNSNHQYPRIQRYEDIINFIQNKKTVSKKELISLYGISRIHTLIKNQVLSEETKVVRRDIHHHFELEDKKIDLTLEQQFAVNQISLSFHKHTPFLLKGITGSGKTEVYLNLIEKITNLNKKVLILVPEINLIAPMAMRLKSRFDEVAIYHSMLSSGQRYDQYQMIINHQANIILGTRSASFLPITDLGLIIIDEEHAPSYIQTDGVFYDAKEILMFRSKYHQIPIVFGSATPSVVSMYYALNKKYELLELNSRPNELKLPEIHFVNMTDELKHKNTKIFSRLLLSKMEDRIKRGQQTILLLNRKGYAPFVMCRTCGDVPMCPTCDISLTYYKDKSLLKCHYCGYEKSFDKSCQVCQNHTIKEVGVGIEYVYDELKKVIPNARILRMDKNMIRSKDAHEIYWKSFLDHDFDILLGTQMISKGLDFPKVTLVGVLMADSLLKIPSYQASELTYNMLTQTTGRSGRFIKGEAVIQGYDLSHYAIDSVSKNYETFYKEAIFRRKISEYEPFYFTAQMLFEGTSYLKTYQHAFLLKKELSQIGFKVIGPSLAIRKKILDRYRFLITLKSKDQNTNVIKHLMDLYAHKDIRMRYYPYIDLI